MTGDTFEDWLSRFILTVLGVALVLVLALFVTVWARGDLTGPQPVRIVGTTTTARPAPTSTSTSSVPAGVECVDASGFTFHTDPVSASHWVAAGYRCRP